MMRRTSQASLKMKGRDKSTHQEHVNIYKAIKTNKPEQAFKVMLDHLSAPLKLLEMKDNEDE